MPRPEDRYSVRLAAATDARQIAALINTAFNVEKFFVDGDRISEEEVLRLLGRGSFLIAQDAETLAGCVYVERGAERAYLGLLSVSPERQHQGIGRLLVAASEDHAREAACKFMDLRVVNLRSELPPFYRKLGYRETGVAPFPEGVQTRLPCHFIIMTRPL